MGWKNSALSVVRRLGGLRLLEGAYGRDRLTVLAYHRVVDHAAPGFAGFRGNVSATPEEFSAQIAWLAERMSPVSLDQVSASLRGVALPPRAVLVTFDDGYRDNLTDALPVLERHGVPAAIFLATDHIGTATPFWWDQVGWWFARTEIRHAELPILGERSWSAHHRIALEWIQRAKGLPESAKQEAVAALGETLGSVPVEGAFDGTLLTWDEVRTLADRGVTVGAHTCSHPILTRVGREEARREIVDSIARVAEETGRATPGFAYPNGHADDFDTSSREAVAAAGVPLGFSLMPGPARASEIRHDPLAIRRVYVHHGDAVDRLAAKVAGLPRVWRRT